MGLLRRLAVGADAADEAGGGDQWRIDRREVAEKPFGELEDRIGIDRAGGGNNQPRRAIFLRQPGAAIVAGQREDAFLAAQHGAGQRLWPERGFEQMVVDQIVGRVAAFAKLGQDNLFFALQLGLVDPRAADQVGDQFERKPAIGRQGAGVKHGLVARGPGVQRAADILDRLGNLRARRGRRRP